MNCNSKYYDDYEPCKRDIEMKIDHFPTIIKCSAPGSVIIPLATPVGSTFTPASLTLNTSCICNPCTKIEVTSNLTTLAFTGAVSFQVMKQCRNQFTPVPVGPAFTYSQLVAITESSTFTFFVCDCDSCDHDCCRYTLVATVTTITAGTLTVANATLGAITTGQPSLCCSC
jgi:hypothetical protein